MNEERTFNMHKHDRNYKADNKSLINQSLCLSIKKLEKWGSGIKDYYKLQVYYKMHRENIYNNSCNCNAFCNNSKP